MAIQLPDDLAVPDRLRIERIEPAPVIARGATAGEGIETPVDRIAEREPLVAEEIEAPAARVVGDLHGLVARRRHPVDQKARRPLAHRAVEEVAGAEGAEALEAQRMIGAEARARHHTSALETLGGFLTSPTDQLVGAGARQTPDHAGTPA